jgi:hypothetical protein
LMPPLMPPQPAWKQEARPEPPPAEPAPPQSKPDEEKS